MSDALVFANKVDKGQMYASQVYNEDVKSFLQRLDSAEEDSRNLPHDVKCKPIVPNLRSITRFVLSKQVLKDKVAFCSMNLLLLKHFGEGGKCNNKKKNLNYFTSTVI